MKIISIVATSIVVAFVSIAAVKISANAAANTKRQSIADSKIQLTDISARVKDRATLLAVASHQTLVAAAPALQQAARDAQALAVPQCLASVKANLMVRSRDLSDITVAFLNRATTVESIRESAIEAIIFNRDLPDTLDKSCI